MTKPAIRLLITDEGYRAIGHVAAQWAYLETELDNLLHIFLSQKAVKKLNLPDSKSFKGRMSNLKKMSNLVLKSHRTELNELKEIITDASSLRGFRDDIIHGRWKLKRKGSTLSPGIVIINSPSSNKVKDIKFTYENAEEVASKISEVTLRASNWRLKNVSEK